MSTEITGEDVDGFEGGDSDRKWNVCGVKKLDHRGKKDVQIIVQICPEFLQRVQKLKSHSTIGGFVVGQDLKTLRGRYGTNSHRVS